jgi:histidine triad (HIT) family protein
MTFLSQEITRGSQAEWEKPDPTHTFRGRLDGTRSKPGDVVYEDEFVYAFRHHLHKMHQTWWEIHVVIIPKKWIPTILDFGLGDIELWQKLLHGIQQVSMMLGLHETGFMVRMGVLPPYQHTEYVHIHILAGKHENAESCLSAPTPPVD